MHYLGIDVGGSSIKTGVVNDAGQLVQEGKISIPESFPAFRQALVAQYRQAASQYNIAGVGISSCGGINPYTGAVTPGIAPALQYLIGENYYTLREDIPVPIVLEKDGNCAALGEMWTGNATDLHSFCALVLGSGLGGGVVYHGQVYEGAHFLAGDVGYAYPSHEAQDGFSGLCAPVHVENRYAALTGQRKNLAEMYQSRQEDAAARQCCQAFFGHLANTIITMQYILDPQAFLIGGGITAWEQLIPLLQGAICQQAEKRGLPVCPQVRRCAHRNGANLLGAVYNLKMKENL